MILLDSDIISLLHHGSEKIQRRLDAVSDAERVAIPLICWIEALTGRFDSVLKAANRIELLQAISRLQRSQEWLDSFAIVPIDEPAANEFEKLISNKKLKKIGRADLLIASIALANKALLVTRNVRHFEQVSGLRIENWAA